MNNIFSKLFLIITILVLAISCNQKAEKSETTTTTKDAFTTRFYSKIVADTFSISVKLPNDYDKKEKYPIVYVLDANIYFDILNTTINRYNEIGSAPSVILVGIGYKNFEAMDSLRNRDDTYPIANAEYEMSVSGGADKFLGFITTELIPHIDKEYKTDTTKRVLMGHSLGGYFTSYALLQNVLGRQNSFSAFIAASPSIHYNNFYLLNQFKTVAQQQNRNKVKVYFTFGELEDKEDEDEPNSKKVGEVAKELTTLLGEKQSNNLDFKCDIFSNLAHMDTPIPSFLKGLQWTLQTNE
jgi:predicted alpha/beta superfamily hydrolase